MDYNCDCKCCSSYVKVCENEHLFTYKVNSTTDCTRSSCILSDPQKICNNSAGYYVSAMSYSGDPLVHYDISAVVGQAYGLGIGILVAIIVVVIACCVGCIVGIYCIVKSNNKKNQQQFVVAQPYRA